MALKEYIMSLRVYIEDTDIMGIVNHARYINYFERARTDMLHRFGLSLLDLAKEDLYFAIRDLCIRYHYPARLEDTLSIVTVLEAQKACSLQFKQTMFNQNKQLISEVSLCAVMVDHRLKPKRGSKLILGD